MQRFSVSMFFTIKLYNQKLVKKDVKNLVGWLELGTFDCNMCY